MAPSLELAARFLAAVYTAGSWRRLVWRPFARCRQSACAAKLIAPACYIEPAPRIGPEAGVNSVWNCNEMLTSLFLIREQGIPCNAPA
jgi:hypothetical protein